MTGEEPGPQLLYVEFHPSQLMSDLTALECLRYLGVWWPPSLVSLVQSLSVYEDCLL